MERQWPCSCWPEGDITLKDRSAGSGIIKAQEAEGTYKLGSD